MNPNHSAEFETYLFDELREKLHFLKLAARNKDFTELEYIVDHLAKVFSRFEYNRSYANTKQLEMSISTRKPQILEDTNRFITKVGEDFGVSFEKMG